MKICTKCKKRYPVTIRFFPPNKRCKDGLGSWCRICCKKYEQSDKGKLTWKKYRQSSKHKQVQKRYYENINVYLRHKYAVIKYRCNNSECKQYKDYGGRGIELRFTVNNFIDYVVNDLGYNTTEMLKGLQIDRINNDGHYELGNIRFVTAKINSNNRRK